MTRPLRSSSDASAGYTRLERAVFEALAAELAAQVPDLARQVAASRPTVRQNSGFGVFTETAVPPSFHPSGAASGDLGSVHAVLSGLSEPVRFTARLQQGRLVGLMGDSYGQDTRQIDFATAQFTQLFTVDPSGRSIPVDRPAVPTPPTPRARPAAAKAPPPPTPAPIPAPSSAEDALSLVFGAKPASSSPRRTSVPATSDPPRAPLSGALQAVQNHAKYDQSAAMFAGTVAPPGSLPRPGDPVTDRTSLLIGVYVVLAFAVVLARLLFDIPWIFALIVAFWIGAALRKPKAVDALQRGVDTWNASRSGR